MESLTQEQLVATTCIQGAWRRFVGYRMGTLSALGRILSGTYADLGFEDCKPYTERTTIRPATPDWENTRPSGSPWEGLMVRRDHSPDDELFVSWRNSHAYRGSFLLWGEDGVKFTVSVKLNHLLRPVYDDRWKRFWDLEWRAGSVGDRTPARVIGCLPNDPIRWVLSSQSDVSQNEFNCGVVIRLV